MGKLSWLEDMMAALTARYTLRLAPTADDLRAAQWPRYEVFNLELDEGLTASNRTGLDVDDFDAARDHLLVVDRLTDAVVGTYRLQTGTAAGAFRGYYSEQEFDLGPFEDVRDEIVELGRAGVAAAHRNQVVRGVLRKGISAYAGDHGARYLVGCSSVTSQDEAEGMAVFDALAPTNLVGPRWRTKPQGACRCRRGMIARAAVPRLMATYLAIGAKICGAPAIEREFKTIDFLTWLDLASLPERVRRKLLS